MVLGQIVITALKISCKYNPQGMYTYLYETYRYYAGGLPLRTIGQKGELASPDHMADHRSSQCVSDIVSSD